MTHRDKKRIPLDVSLLAAFRGQGMTIDEIACQVGVSRSTVERRFKEVELTTSRYAGIGHERPDNIERWAKSLP